MFWSRRHGGRRAEIRKNRPDSSSRRFRELRAGGVITSLWIAAVFCIAATLILLMRENVVPYRPGEYTPYDIVARVPFRYADKEKVAELRQLRRDIEPHVYKVNDQGDPNGDIYHRLKDLLVNLPQRVAKLSPDELPSQLRQLLDSASLTVLQDAYATPAQANKYVESVNAYLDEFASINPIVLSEDQRHEELSLDLYRTIVIPSRSTQPIPVETTYSTKHLENLDTILQGIAGKDFIKTLAPKIVALTIDTLKENPTHVIDPQATNAAQNLAAEKVTVADAEVLYEPKATIIPRGEISTRGWQMLREENRAYLHQDGALWKTLTGTAASVLILTICLAIYIAKFQPRIVRNHARSVAIGGLMLSMLLLAQIAGIGSSPAYVFGIAPTIVVAMILTIAYDQRFAMGVSAIHAALVTLATNQSLSFFLVLLAGVLTCCFLLDDIRTRSKLVEVGGVTAVVLILACCASSLMQLQPPEFIFRNALYAGAAGLGVGFVVLGILPFIEKSFKITTSMTLLELADVSHPVLRRLSLEAPGTYNHSLQVATLAEEAAEAISANALLCRVGSYYHDIGKINKPDYFIENQSGGENRHLALTPDLSYRIIINHVKDGAAMAKEYNLPTKLLPFIEQHHGTTLVEFFYKRACDNCEPNGPKISEWEFRYPGPKPKSKEIAIVMLADCVQSASQAMVEPTSSRIETLVNDLAMRRLLDGQFDECDLTMRDLERIKSALSKTLQSFYHGRIAYPSTRAVTQSPQTPQPPPQPPAAGVQSA